MRSDACLQFLIKSCENLGGSLAKVANDLKVRGASAAAAAVLTCGGDCRWIVWALSTRPVRTRC
jgi:hypothetical protein